MKSNLSTVALFCIILNASLLQTGLCQNNFGRLNTKPCLTGELFSTEKLSFDTWFNKEWAQGEILLVDGTVSRDSMIRYNSFLDELFWLEPVSGRTVKLDKLAIDEFRIINPAENKNIIFRRLHTNSFFLADSTDIFAEVLYSGGITLYLRHYFYFQGTQVTGPNNNRRLKDIYLESPVYYIKLKNNVLSEVHLRRKNLYALFPDKTDAIRKYWRNHVVSTPEEITWLAEFLDTLR
ncbi:MAG: hypothetical protein ACM3NR_00435 [Methanosarcina sp.]